MPATPTDISFDSGATTYKPTNAYWLARAANIAYQDKSTIQAAVADIGLDNFQFLSHRDTEGYIAANERNIVVAFRGTEPSHIQDLLSDAKIHKVRGPLGRVHRGFLHAFELVKDDMFDGIQRFRNEDKPQSVWCTGHSLGAALAVVAVAELLAEDQTVNGLYNFGQPRVGNKEFAHEFNSRFSDRHFRFVNNNDTVTRVPPREFGYKHTGTLRYIDNKGEIREAMGAWKRFLDRLKGRADDLLDPGTDGLKDHSMGQYVEHIEHVLKPGA
ncbi:MAG: lipase family protein [Gammaproteobacteria bacterium]|nr:lipase family protein [Gammaproteobacteria bacterium]